MTVDLIHSTDWERAAHMLSDKLERANELAEHTQVLHNSRFNW